MNRVATIHFPNDDGFIHFPMDNFSIHFLMDGCFNPQFMGLFWMYSAMSWYSRGFRIMWSWNRDCQWNAYPNRWVCFDTADLYDPMMDDIEFLPMF